MRILSIVIIICFACTFKTNAQQDTSKKTTVTLAAMYSSNISYYGQVTSERLPYVLVNATVRLPVGLYFSAGSYKLLNYGTGISETDLGVGYSHDFTDKMAASLGYTRSFFPANSPLLQASNENNVNASVNYKWTWFKSAFSTDYAFGKQHDIFVSLSNSKEIALGSLFNEKNQISIEPTFEVVAGTRHFYETYIIEKDKRDKAKGKGKAQGSPGNSGQNTTTTVSLPSTNFKPLSYNLKLPLTFSRAHYMAEISGQFSVLGPHTEIGVNDRQAFFGFAFYYQF